MSQSTNLINLSSKSVDPSRENLAKQQHHPKASSREKDINVNYNPRCLEATPVLKVLANKDAEDYTKLPILNMHEEGNNIVVAHKNLEQHITPNPTIRNLEIEPEKRLNPDSNSSSVDDTETTSSTSLSETEYSNSSDKQTKRRKLSTNKRKKYRKIKSRFIVPACKIDQVTGKNQDQIKQISETSRTICTIHDKTSIQEKESKITIRGSRQSVKKAKVMIMDVLYAPYQGEYTDYVSVPVEKCGMIIGKGGDVIKNIKEKSGTRCDIDMNKWNGGKDKYLVIRGPPDCVDIAKDMFINILENDREDTFEDYIIVSTKKIGVIMGKGGETIKAITKSTGAICELDKECKEEAREKRIYIKGKINAINKAKQMIMETMYAPRDGEYTDFISVPYDMCGLIIGKKGETIKEINQISNALCEVDENAQSDSLDKHIIIRGSVQAIEKAKSMIKEKLDILYPHERLFSSDDDKKYKKRETTRNQYVREGTTSTSVEEGYVSSSHSAKSGDKCFLSKRYGMKIDESSCQDESSSINLPLEYSREWVEYYRSMGMLSEAQEIVKWLPKC